MHNSLIWVMRALPFGAGQVRRKSAVGGRQAASLELNSRVMRANFKPPLPPPRSNAVCDAIDAYAYTKLEFHFVFNFACINGRLQLGDALGPPGRPNWSESLRGALSLALSLCELRPGKGEPVLGAAYLQ